MGVGAGAETKVRRHSIPIDILDDLGSRFIINVPECERNDVTRICFQIELAHWFYIDEYVSNSAGYPGLRSCNFREFAEHMFRHISFLRGYADDVDDVLDNWREYRLSVPTYGAIIINEDLTKVLLAQGYWSKNNWGFPKGKVNQEEAPHDCASREVLEETGFDISKIIDRELYLQALINDQTVCLFLIPGVPTSTHFAPKTKNEIRELRWFVIDDLPTTRKDVGTNPNCKLTAANLFMVLPFMKGLKKWVGQYRRIQNHQHHLPQHLTQPHRKRLDSYNEQQNRQQQSLMHTKRQQQNQRKNSRQQQQQQQQFQDQYSAFKPVAENQTGKQQKKSKQENKQTQQQISQQQQQPSGPCETKVGDFTYTTPKVWSGFRLKKKEIIAAMFSTPGWVAESK